MGERRPTTTPLSVTTSSIPPVTTRRTTCSPARRLPVGPAIHVDVPSRRNVRLLLQVPRPSRRQQPARGSRTQRRDPKMPKATSGRRWWASSRFV